MVVNMMQSAVAKRIEVGAEGGSRTRTSLRTTDFKSAASAIPPPRHVRKNSTAQNSRQTLPRYCWQGVESRVCWFEFSPHRGHEESDID